MAPGRRNIKHVAAFVCVTYTVSWNAFVGKYTDF